MHSNSSTLTATLLTATLLAATVLTAHPLRAQGLTACSHELSQKYRFHDDLLCAWHEYCYTLSVDRSCKLPATKLCVRFDHLDEVSSVSSPSWWSHSIIRDRDDPKRGLVCWTSSKANGVWPGRALSGFCVKSRCNPRGVEGVQRWSTRLPENQAGKSGLTTIVAMSTRLHGDRIGARGNHARIAARNPQPRAMGVLLLSLGKATIDIPGVDGKLLLEPSSSRFLAVMHYGTTGRGEVRLLLPGAPSFSGIELYFQAVDLGATRFRLSNRWPLLIR